MGRLPVGTAQTISVQWKNSLTTNIVSEFQSSLSATITVVSDSQTEIVPPLSLVHKSWNCPLWTKLMKSKYQFVERMSLYSKSSMSIPVVGIVIGLTPSKLRVDGHWPGVS